MRTVEPENRRFSSLIVDGSGRSSEERP
jgi:hypothetical protein